MKTFLVLFLFSYISIFSQNSFSLKTYNEYNELFSIQEIKSLDKIVLGKDSITYKYILKKEKDTVNIKNIIFSISDSNKRKVESLMKNDNNLVLYCFLAIHDWDEYYSRLGEDRYSYSMNKNLIRLDSIMFIDNDILLKNKQISVTLLLMNELLDLPYEKRIFFFKFYLHTFYRRTINHK